MHEFQVKSQCSKFLTMNPFNQPNLTLAPQETIQYTALFNKLDTQQQNNITAQQTYGFLLKSGLEQSILSKIWDLSDKDKRGSLTREEFLVACKLVALAQASKPVGRESLSIPTPMALFQEVMPANRTGTSIAPMKIEHTGSSLTLQPDERVRFTSFFEVSGPVDGFLSGF